MIDLDEQLTAYVSYLDDAERSVTVLAPRPIRPEARSGRWLAAAAAAVLVVGGSVAVATLRSDDGGGATGTSESGWTVVPDPDGVFVPEPGEVDDASDPYHHLWGDNVRVESMEWLSAGFVAVGVERRGFAPIAAVWRSRDGVEWKRVEDDSFGAVDATDDPAADGPSMVGVAELDGRAVIAGSLSQWDAPAIWVTDDWESWDVVPVAAPDADTYPTAIAAGADGFVMVGIDSGSNAGVQDVGVVWFSADGLDWVPATIEDSWGAHVRDVMYTQRGWVASGSIGSAAAVWSSVDGTTWSREDVEQTPDERLQFTSIDHLVEFGGRVVGLGSAESSGGVSLERRYPDTVIVNGTAQPAVWFDDGESSWTAVSPVEYDDATFRYPGAAVATGDELILFGEELVADRMVSFELQSTDGIAWRRIESALLGARTAAASQDGVVLAAGGAENYVVTNVGMPPAGAGLPSGAVTVWIRHD